jgi:AraC-like DNA-binding protein
VSITEWVTATPAVSVRPFIDRYVGYRMEGFEPGVHRGLPSRHMTFIVSIGAPIDVLAQTNPAQSPDTYRCVLSGLQASPALIADPGYQHGVAIELTPPGARVLFGMPARSLWDLSVELADVAGSFGDELWERLQPAMRWHARFAICDEVLGRLARHRPPASALDRCWRALVASGGTIPITDLASATGYTRQHLARMFRAEFGLSPKLAARIVRFQRARDMLTTVPSFVTIGRVAAACGYTDHAHLVRDVTALAGCTPTELIDGHVPFVQDTAAVGG